ncbi:hypothetical protein KS4_22230 [Poriferisphaera corsica]|uniref:Uncharacterized protein n=1 Tax=Poriferisphaera corsica TaxID=2528020 RepID=A0A517YV98_9BACT|nr:hypothetical protein KS4_22230 [Poriferisphaera corsica]
MLNTEHFFPALQSHIGSAPGKLFFVVSRRIRILPRAAAISSASDLTSSTYWSTRPTPRKTLIALPPDVSSVSTGLISPFVTFSQPHFYPDLIPLLRPFQLTHPPLIRRTSVIINNQHITIPSSPHALCVGHLVTTSQPSTSSPPPLQSLINSCHLESAHINRSGDSPVCITL